MYFSQFNEVEYVGNRQVVKIEQLATKQHNNNLEHIFVAHILGKKSARKQFRPRLSLTYVLSRETCRRISR